MLKAGVLEDGIVTVSGQGDRAGIGDLTASGQSLLYTTFSTSGPTLATA